MKRHTLKHEFVEYVPPGEDLAEGTLYVSVAYATAVHRCCCGCGGEVVTPLSPAQWRLTFDGQTVSLHPSVGSGTLPCRSHYWIREGQVRWCRPLSEVETRTGRIRDRAAAEHLFADQMQTPPAAELADQLPEQPIQERRSAWRRLLGLIGRG